jgi:hypothetical protein
MSDHVYISTACTHKLHHECRLKCKWCDSTCECDCHDDEPAAGDNPELQTAAAALLVA